MTSKRIIGETLELLGNHRWAALATVDEGQHPHVSMVGYSCEEDLSALYLHLSRLAAHTGHLLFEPRCAMVVSANDTGEGDPQLLPRVSMTGSVGVAEKGSDDYLRGRQRYLERLPASEQLFDFPDFLLFRFTLVELRYVGGFGRAFTLTPSELHGD